MKIEENDIEKKFNEAARIVTEAFENLSPEAINMYKVGCAIDDFSKCLLSNEVIDKSVE